MQKEREHQKTLLEGIEKINISDFGKYEYKKRNWNFKRNINNTRKNIIQKYIQKGNEELIVDDCHKPFLKGYVFDEKMCGERIFHLPSGKRLARGGFSIHAKNLLLNSKTKTSWDICYENSSGTKTYLYSEEKIHLEQIHKAEIVDKFKLMYPKIKKKIIEDLKNKNEIEYLLLYIILKTHMRVGDIYYYKKLQHQGATTLQKKNITIFKDKQKILFQFTGKDGVPQCISKKFPLFVIEKIEKILNKKNDDDFVFLKKNNNIVHSSDLSKILFEYTKEHFYPHIIRSFYADSQCQKFLKNYKKLNENNKENNKTNNKTKALEKEKNKIQHKNKTKKNTKKKLKKEVEDLLLHIAENLGHKKYNRKKKKWEICYNVTVKNYIRPSLYEKLVLL